MSNNFEMEEYDEFLNMDDSQFNEEHVAGMMDGLLNASNEQMKIAVELTKLAVGNNANEEQVFSTFRKAHQVVAESFANNSLLEQFGTQQ